MSTQPLHRLRTVRSSHYVWADARIPVGGEIELAQPAKPRLKRLGVEVLDLVADEEMGGLALSDCVINSDNILALRDPCLDALLAELDLGEHERIPSRVLDAQRQGLSDDYAVVNFLERADALDLDRTDAASAWLTTSCTPATPASRSSPRRSTSPRHRDGPSSCARWNRSRDLRYSNSSRSTSTSGVQASHAGHAQTTSAALWRWYAAAAWSSTRSASVRSHAKIALARPRSCRSFHIHAAVWRSSSSTRV